MTEKLYYADAYKKEFQAEVVKVVSDGEHCKACLDRTAFYPEGGGQGADHGVLELADGRLVEVNDVQETDEEIWHDLSEPVEKGIRVTGRIDWERRFDHMQQHSGEHIVSGMICRTFHCDNVGFHLGDEIVTIDFNTRISYEQAEQIEAQANRYIWEDHPFQVLFPTKEELKSLEYRSKKEIEGTVRIARFPGADTCACCGTHVSGSAQVGLVKFLSAKNFHEGTRLELLCGKRAMEYLSMNYNVNKAAAVLLSTSEENTGSHVRKLLEEHMQLKAQAAEMEDRLFHLWAESYRGQGNVLVIDDHLNATQARTLADLIADCCTGTAAVFAKEEERYHYAVIRRNGDISDLIKELNRVLNGRGGGRNGFAQGSVSAQKEDIEAFFHSVFA